MQENRASQTNKNTKISIPLSELDEITNDPTLRAALHHRSARSNVANLLSDQGYPTAILESWKSLGTTTLSFYSALVVLNSEEHTTAGALSVTLAKLKQFLTNQIGSAIYNADIIVFGNGVTEQERNSSALQSGMAEQLIGSIAHKKGLRAAIDFIPKVVAINKFSMPVGKDAKTQLQEFSQKKKLGLPTYETTNVAGTKNNPTFSAKVIVGQKSSSGIGTTKRFAEQNAATSFLKTYLPETQKYRTLNLTSGIRVPEIAKPITGNPNTEISKRIARSLHLEDWAGGLISLALTHASYTPKIHRTQFGQDNKLLSCFGSLLFLWLAQDAIIRHLHPNIIIRAGGVAILTVKLLDNNNLTKLFDNIISEEWILLGPGENKPNIPMKVEFIQAFCGAIFLARHLHNISSCNDFCSGIPELEKFITEYVKSLPLERDLALHPKTSLQERCQAIGINLEYIPNAGIKYSNSKLVLRSPWLQYPIEVNNNDTPAANTVITRTELESSLALKTLCAFDIITGKAFDVRNVNYTKNGFLERWLLEHTIYAATQYALKQNNESPRKKPLNIDILGSPLLQTVDFISFKSWVTKTHQIHPSLFDEKSELLFDFYATIGRQYGPNLGQVRLTQTLDSLEEILLSADPLSNTDDIRKSTQFQRLIQLATGRRLLANSISNTTISEIIEETAILYKGALQLSTREIDHSAKVLEIQGAHLALIDLLVHSTKVHNESPCIELSTSNENLEFSLKLNILLGQKILEDFENTPLWNTLKFLLPAVSHISSDGVVKIVIHSLVKNDTDALAHKFWWRYFIQGSLRAVANDTIATMLHDLKNSILGYASTAAYAQRTISRERYQHAANASNHLNTALATIGIARGILRTTGKLPTELVSIGSFMKAMISELWSWFPTGVTISPPSELTDVTVWSNQSRLHSIISNLARNSVEAMNGKGVFSIDCDMEGDNGIFIAIGDTGPGLTEQQLVSLNSGNPISSSKKHGQGLGLLTVLLLVKELNGSVNFSRPKSGGCVTNIWIPSNPPEEIDRIN